MNNSESQTPPAARVPWADVTESIADLKDGELLVGVGADHQPEIVNINEHIAMDMRAGTGKTVLARSLAAQLLHQGAQVVVLDLQQITHPWMRDLNLPGVTYASTIPEIHAALVWARTEIGRRCQIAVQSADPETGLTGDIGPRIMYLFEELGYTADQLKQFWKETTRIKGQSRSPALEALDYIRYVGRAVRVHLVSVSGSYWPGSLGQAWTPGVLCKTPAIQRQHGQIEVVKPGMTQATVQIPYITGQDARDWATTGNPATSAADPAVVTLTAGEPWPERLPLVAPGEARNARVRDSELHDYRACGNDQCQQTACHAWREGERHGRETAEAQLQGLLASIEVGAIKLCKPDTAIMLAEIQGAIGMLPARADTCDWYDDNSPEGETL